MSTLGQSPLHAAGSASSHSPVRWLSPKATARLVIWLCMLSLSFLSMERTSSRMTTSIADDPMMDWRDHRIMARSRTFNADHVETGGSREQSLAVSPVVPARHNVAVSSEANEIASTPRATMDAATTDDHSVASLRIPLEGTIATVPTNDATNNGHASNVVETMVNEQNSVVVQWEGLDAMNAFVDSIWVGNLFCQTIQETRALLQNTSRSSLASPHTPVSQCDTNWITIQMSFGCQDLFLHSDSGTGNFVMALYMMRLSAGYLGNVTLDLSCTDAHETKASLILPWLMSRRTHRPDPNDHERLQAALAKEVWEVDAYACERFVLTPLGLVIQDMQYDLRKMAIALVGPRPHHASMDFAERYLYDDHDPTAVWKRGDVWNMTSSIVPQLANPLRSDPPLLNPVDLDDAVIHFRCGDLLTTNLVNYGFLRFDAFVRHISSEARTIGILTQPFGDETVDENVTMQHRPHDSGAEISRRCRVLVTALQDYVQERHPRAVVTIRNDPKETITMAYARIIMANESVAAMSTFSIFPVMATFGTGYFLRPEGSQPNAWFRNYPVSLDLLTGRQNVIVFDIDEGAIRVGGTTRITWDENGDDPVLAWFRG